MGHAVSENKTTKQSFRAMLISMGTGAVVGYFVGAHAAKFLPRWFDLSDFNRADGWWLLLALPALYLLSIAAHELGHLVGAVLGGFRFRVLTIGPFSLVAHEQRVRVRFSWSVMTFIGGQQISSPPIAGANDRQFMLYLLGGGVANLLAAGSAVSIALALNFAGLVVAMLLMFAGINLFMGVVNLLPLSTQTGVRTDGYQIRTLLRGADDARRFRALFALIAEIYAGTRPRDWPTHLLPDLLAGQVNGLERATANLMHLQVALDLGDTDGAAAAASEIEAFYDRIPAAVRAQFAAELTQFYAVVKGDAVRARRYANQITEKAYLICPATVHRGRAAALFAEGQYDAALVEIELGLRQSDHASNEFDRLIEPDWLRQLQQTILSRHQAA
jgi:hypothetical protein